MQKAYSSQHPPKKQRSIWPLIAILLICLAPVMFALAAYYLPELGIRPSGQNNYGKLIQPQRPLPNSQHLALETRDNKAVDPQQLKGKWLLITVDGGSCDEACVRKLFILRNSHASLGKNVRRVERIWFLTDKDTIDPTILEAYAGTQLLQAKPEQLAAFFTPDAKNTQQALKNRMWVIDPQGNLILEFPPNADPIRVRDDIRKLVKNSRLG